MGKHKKRKSVDIDLPEDNTLDSSVTENGVKKKKKSHENNVENTQQDGINDSSNSPVKKKKKKKSEDKLDEEAMEATVSHKIHKEKKKKKKKDNESPNEVDTEQIEESVNNCKKKKKKRKHDLSECEETNDSTQNEDGDSTHKNKKKKRKHESPDGDEENVVHDKNTDEIVTHKSKKKKKKKHADVVDDAVSECKKNAEEEIKIKNKKMRNETVDSETENLNGAAFVKQSPAQEKFQDSKIRKPEPVAGQWNTASLGDENRQNKFLRLLGGFKKGGDTATIQNKFSLGKKSTTFPAKSTQPAPRHGGNFAMDKRQEDEYVKNMEKDYERAMASNLSRGIGLGFAKPPEEGKKFYIDTNKSKSIKFD